MLDRVGRFSLSGIHLGQTDLRERELRVELDSQEELPLGLIELATGGQCNAQVCMRQARSSGRPPGPF